MKIKNMLKTMYVNKSATVSLLCTLSQIAFRRQIAAYVVDKFHI